MPGVCSATKLSTISLIIPDFSNIQYNKILRVIGEHKKNNILNYNIEWKAGFYGYRFYKHISFDIKDMKTDKIHEVSIFFTEKGNINSQNTVETIYCRDPDTYSHSCSYLKVSVDLLADNVLKIEVN